MNKFDIKVYDKDGKECETIRDLNWAQAATLEIIFLRLEQKIKIIAVVK